MIELTLNEEMLEQLRSMKGKKLQSYEHFPCPTEYQNPGFMRINFAGFSFDIEIDYKAYSCTGFSGKTISDEASCFSIRKQEINNKYSIPEGWSMRRYLIGETVSEVMIIRDTICVNNGDTYLIDNAIVIKTSENTYTLSKGCETDPSMYVKCGNSIDVKYSVYSERQNYSDKEHKIKAKVQRDYIFL